MTKEQKKVQELRDIVTNLEKDINNEKSMEANQNQGKRMQEQKESMQNMLQPMQNYYDSIVENINYTECINGKCSTIDIMNTSPGTYIETNYTNHNIDKYTTSRILKDNLDNLVYIIFVIFVVICLVQVLMYKKQGYLVSILIATLVFIFYKIIMR